ncbi:MAG: heavy-metal-associated domain-containing protein [Sulfurovum sp.]
MKQIFQVLNVKCGGCASTLQKSLHDEFGEVSVNLEKEPREIILDIDDEKVTLLAEKLKKLGYPLVSEDMGFVEGTTVKAKSFVSCAIGKIGK